MTHGVMRKVIRGIPPLILKKELNSKKAQIEIRGTSKAGFMKGDPKVTKLIKTSVYDTNPVN